MLERSGKYEGGASRKVGVMMMMFVLCHWWRKTSEAEEELSLRQEQTRFMHNQKLKQ